MPFSLPKSASDLRHAVRSQRDELIAFTQKLVQTPSMPGKEDQIAALIQQKMKVLGYDEVTTDNYGTVIGRLKGGSGPSLMLNCHMDHVDPGDPAGWPHPPFSGKIVNDELWGRASVDMKGPLACMVYAPAILKELDLTPPGDLYVTTAVMEEVGGIGTSHLAEHLQTDFAIVGEPSQNTLRLGHRGRVEVQVIITGKSIHASIPHAGLNPHYILADFLKALPQLSMASDPRFGQSTLAPTLLHSDQNSANVTPGQLTLTLDWRNIPSESPQAILSKVDDVLQACLPPQAEGKVILASHQFTTYTGQQVEQSALFPSFGLPEDHPLAQMAQQTLSHVFQQAMPFDIWRFATDGGHLMAANIPTIGFGPGDDTLPHTNQERIPLNQLEEGLLGYVALSLGSATLG